MGNPVIRKRHCLTLWLCGSLVLNGSVLSAPVGPSEQESPQCKITVGNNVRATVHDTGDLTYAFEPNITVNPKNPRNIVVGVTAKLPPAKPGATPHHKPENWYSKDGGKTWHRAAWPEVVREVIDKSSYYHASVIFDGDGDLLSTFDGSNSWLLRSGTGGVRWTDATPMSNASDAFPGSDKLPKHIDRGNVAADRTGGPRHGTVYLTSVHATFDGKSLTPSQLDFFSYDPRDRQWRHQIISSNAMFYERKVFPFGVDFVSPGRDILIRRDGTILIPIAVGIANYQLDDRGTLALPWLAVSRDGGKSFPELLPMTRTDGHPLENGGQLDSRYGIDTSDGPHRDTIYRTWVSKPSDREPWQLVLSRSTDGGRVWSDAQRIEDIANPGNVMRSGSYAYVAAAQPIVTVNAQGVLLLSWYRFAAGPKGADGKPTIMHQRYVTASMDGGKTFLTPVPLASEVTQDLRPPYARAAENANGDLGHYMQVDTDPSGTFHHAWLDGRTGKQELWYAPVTVKCGG